MNPQETFDAWKTQKAQVAMSGDFADRVMTGIRRRQPAQAAGSLQPLLRYVTARPWAKAAVLVTGTLLGLGRIVVTIHLVLFA